jgi:hypothetical protein
MNPGLAVLAQAIPGSCNAAKLSFQFHVGLRMQCRKTLLPKIYFTYISAGA